MSIFDAIIQGIIQGLTEFLPVSSSGHLSISKHIFGIEMPGILFDIMLHLGTLIAVVFVYRQLIWRLIKEFGSLCVDIAQPGPAKPWAAQKFPAGNRPKVTSGCLYHKIVRTFQRRLGAL